MRFLLALGGLVCAGCVGPHTSGGLWSQQNLQREIAQSRVTQATRTAQAQVYEQATAAPLLAAERARVADLVRMCPGTTRQPLAISDGDRVRDRVRVLAHADTDLQKGVAAVAQADWFARRGQATGDERACARARAALDGEAGMAATPGGTALSGPTAETAARSGQAPGGAAASGAGLSPGPTEAATARALLDALGPATVSRDGGLPATATATATSTSDPRVRVVADPPESRLATISAYALQASDTVTAPAPLPQYLARVYGGTLIRSAAAPNLGGRTPEAIVDDVAPVVADWEPDALLAALSPSQAQ